MDVGFAAGMESNPQSRISSYERLLGIPRLDTFIRWANALGYEVRLVKKCD